MSNLRSDQEYDRPTTALKFILRQWSKNLHTCLPGIVEDFDPATRRARVQPAVQKLMTDGGLKDRPPVINVPVVFFGGGPFTSLAPLAAGDAVLLLFSQQGLSHFKAAFAKSPPSGARRFALTDAIAMPGFGPVSITPASEDGLVLGQKTDGTTSVVIDPDGNVTINVPDGKNVHLGGREGDELATKTFVRDHHNRHIHSHPMGPTGPPVTPAPQRGGSDVTEKTKAE